MAAGAQPEEALELELSTDNWGDHRIAIGSNAQSQSSSSCERLQVQSKRLDDILTRLIHPHRHALLILSAT